MSQGNSLICCCLIKDFFTDNICLLRFRRSLVSPSFSALSHFRTQSFAYIGSSSSKEPDSTPSSELIFPRRQYRRLRVVFVVNRLEIIDGEEILIEERFGSFIPDVDDQNHVEPKEFVKESNQDIEMTDPSSSNVDQEKSEEKQEKVDLDTELKKAQKEMMDEELFSELVGQYRRIERKFGLDDDFFGIDDKLIPSSNQRKNLEGGGDSFKPKTKLSMNHLSISLNSKVELRFEMVPTAASDDSKKKKKNLDEITDIKKERYHFSHVASLVRGCFEMEIIRRYRSRAGIDSTTTTSPSGIGHKTNNWKGGKKTLEDERKSQEGHSLQCLIMVVRYFTVSRNYRRCCSSTSVCKSIDNRTSFLSLSPSPSPSLCLSDLVCQST